MKNSIALVCLFFVVFAGCSSSTSRFAMNSSLANAESAEAAAQQTNDRLVALQRAQKDLQAMHQRMKEVEQSATSTSGQCAEKAALHHLPDRAH